MSDINILIPVTPAQQGELSSALQGATIDGGPECDQLLGSTGDDVIHGNAGADNIRGAGGDDVLVGGDGNDMLIGGIGDDKLMGRRGRDHLSGGNGNDSLEGGPGNDYLRGGNGNDVYVFGSFTGLDTIDNVNTEGPDEQDDTIRFVVGEHTLAANAAELTFRRSVNDLLVYAVGDDPARTSVRVLGFFEQDGATSRAVNQIISSRGTLSTLSHIKYDVLVPTSGNDRLHGYAGDDLLHGDLGDDILVGNAGDDELYGEEGRDTLFGGSNDDTLYGGVDDDRLDGDDGDDHLWGQAGNDYLSGGEGYDVLSGGMGRDRLEGGSGSDTYQFARGDGQDIIIESSTALADHDRLVLGDGIDSGHVWLARDRDNLILSLVGRNDRVTLIGWYDDNAARIDTIVLNNGKQLLADKVEMLVQGMAGLRPPPYGASCLPQEHQTVLAPLLAAQWA